jgi:hypothetical protein
VEKLRSFLVRYKLALQPNKQQIPEGRLRGTVEENFGSFEDMIAACESDYLKLRKVVQSDLKKGFPYLSGPKIFNYWSFILCEYGGVALKNKRFIEIAPDTHVTQCSVLLGVISKEESEGFSREKISERWREVLKGSGINPIEMHPPLWFWSKNGFLFRL